MRKKYSIYILAALLVAAPSCQKKFLDQVPDDRLTTDDIFTRQSTTESFLADVYSAVPDEATQRFVAGYNTTAGPWTGAADEAKYSWDNNTANSVILGTISTTDGWYSTLWSRYYKGIRNAGYFMANVDKATILGSALIKQYKAEARALRAMYYYYLVRMFGPVVLTGDNPISPDASFDDVQLPRNSFDDCINYIVSELDAAKPNLLVVPSDRNFGRITQGIAMAFKEQALLLAASPLYNGNTDYAALKNADGTQLINQTYTADKWKKAADAAKAFIDEFVPSVYDLYEKNDADGKFSAYLSCRDVMLTDWNKEWILARPVGNISFWQYDKTPYHNGFNGDVKGGGALAVTQEMVDAYFTANGRSITDGASGYVATGFSSFKAPFDNASRNTYNQWANREPRFYVGVTYDGSRWLNTDYGDVITSTQYSGNSGIKVSGSDHSATGYMVRKNLSLGKWSDESRSLVLFRLANIYLDYVEALNEATPGNENVVKYLNLIRKRAGIPLYGEGTDALDIPATQEAMREAIRKERRVELAFENVRFFDTRRWKIAEQTDAGPKYGLNINADGTNFYNKVVVETRVFAKKHYLLPIPQSEIDKDKQLVQNTGW